MNISFIAILIVALFKNKELDKLFIIEFWILKKFSNLNCYRFSIQNYTFSLIQAERLHILGIHIPGYYNSLLLIDSDWKEVETCITFFF